MEMEELISIKEAARRLGGISPWTVRSWLSQRRLRRVKVGARTMIRASELARFLQDCGSKDSDSAASRERVRS